MSSPPDRAPLFSPAPEEELLYSLARDGSRRYVDPVVTHGRFWRVRVALGWLLIATFVALPIVRVGGAPAVWLDLGARRFHLFGAVYQPTDNLMLLAFGLGFGALVFFVTSAFGRIWCGYGCPQTVYLELLFRPIETIFEGKPAARRKLRAAPPSRIKLLRKGGKWLVYVVVALLLSATFVAYFVTWPAFWRGLTAAPWEHRAAIGAWLGVAALMLLDFGYFRDQMCTVACPYGRLQNVLIDDDTIVVAYDSARGEPRGKPNTRDADGRRGDCIDCRRCIHTCPTGMDIRRGLQLECVGCAQCIEACDEVMSRLGRRPGLIRYTSGRELCGGGRRLVRPRLLFYGALLLGAWGAFAALAIGRADARIELLRAGREAYRPLHTGQVANQLRARISNHRHEEQRFRVTLLAPPGAELVLSSDPIAVPADGVTTANIAIKVDRSAFRRGKADASLLFESDRGGRFEHSFVLLGPYEPAKSP